MVIHLTFSSFLYFFQIFFCVFVFCDIFSRATSPKLPLPLFKFIMPVLTVNSRNTDGTPILKEGEQVLATQPNVSLYFNPAAPEGNGTAYVTTMYVRPLSFYHTVRLSYLYFLFPYYLFFRFRPRRVILVLISALSLSHSLLSICYLLIIYHIISYS